MLLAHTRNLSSLPSTRPVAFGVLGLLIAGLGACASSSAATTVDRDVAARITEAGEFDLRVEAQVEPTGLHGQVVAAGCTTIQDPADIMSVPPPAPPMVRDDLIGTERDATIGALNQTEGTLDREVCHEFPAPGAIISVTAGKGELLGRTDAEGRFVFRDAQSLQVLASAGGVAQVTVHWNGETVRTEVSGITAPPPTTGSNRAMPSGWIAPIP